MQKIAPFLMFAGEQHGRAEEAINFYVELIPRSRVIEIDRYGPGDENGDAGTVRLVRFSIDGLEVMAIDSAVAHQFSFTPSLSLFIEVESEPEFERIFGGLAEAGELLMPADTYGFSRKFGWVNDRFGVSWQVNLA